jgi:hypothetical protein
MACCSIAFHWYFTLRYDNQAVWSKYDTPVQFIPIDPSTYQLKQQAFTDFAGRFGNHKPFFNFAALLHGITVSITINSVPNEGL